MRPPHQPSRVLRRAGLAAAFLASTAVGCAGNAGNATAVDEARSSKLRETSPAVTPADREALAAGNASFALAMHRQLAKPDQNLVFSPISITTALAMTFAGARAETETQMAAALRFTLPQERLHPAMNELDLTLAERGAGAQGADGKPFRLRIVNTIWAQKGFSMQPDFLDTLAVNYGAGVNLLDFMGATERSRGIINAWVQERTEGRIKDLLPMGVLTAATRLVLTNAVYFNAAWKTPFPEKTAKATFRRLDGATAEVQMMRLEAPLPAMEATGGDFQALSLPYQDGRLSLVVVLPALGKFAQVEAALDAPKLAEVVAALQEQAVVLGLPRFKFETPAPLKDALIALGMPAAFAPGTADLSGIDGTRSLYIQDVRHKAFIAVAEKGTEAAAATAVVIGRTSAPQGLHITADRPFLFFLRDAPTGAILFMGHVMDPSAMSGG